MADFSEVCKHRIFIADDHLLLREGMKMLLAVQPDFEVVGEASSGEEALLGLIDTSPDLAILDLGLPGRDGLAVAGAAKKLLPTLRVVMVTGSFASSDREQAIRLGADGYVLKSEPPSVLMETIRSALASGPRPAPSRQAHVTTERESLTERERQILSRIARGLDNNAIAAELHISVLTVRTHRQNIMRKAGASNAAQLASYAIRINCTGD